MSEFLKFKTKPHMLKLPQSKTSRPKQNPKMLDRHPTRTQKNQNWNRMGINKQKLKHANQRKPVLWTSVRWPRTKNENTVLIGCMCMSVDMRFQRFSSFLLFVSVLFPRCLESKPICVSSMNGRQQSVCIRKRLSSRKRMDSKRCWANQPLFST